MNWKNIFKIAGMSLLFIFIGVSLSFTSIERKDILMADLQVKIKDSYQFVTAREIKNIVSKNFKGLKGAMIDSINTQVIELKIEEQPWVKNAEVFKGYAQSDDMKLKGRIKITIEQEVPVLRVVNEDRSYFVNEAGKRLPATGYYSKSIPVFTGKINDKMMQNNLLPFVSIINADPFWKALIQQVHVLNNGELIIVPRVGNHKIEFGKPEKIETKLRNLMLVYTRGFEGDAWNKYKTVTLKYNNQVVCTLR